jgi:hypothetical protein
MHLRFICAAVLPLLSLGPVSTVAEEPREPPPVWEQVRWGMTVEELQTLYPDIAPFVASGAKMSQEPEKVLGMEMSVYELRDRSFGPIDGCRLRIPFIDERLWQIQFKCKGADPDEIRRVLTNRYGFPQPGSAGHLVWKLERTHIGFNPRSGQFSLSDRRQSQNLSLGAFGALMRARARAGQDRPEESSGTPEAPEAGPDEALPSEPEPAETTSDAPEER